MIWSVLTPWCGGHALPVSGCEIVGGPWWRIKSSSSGRQQTGRRILPNTLPKPVVSMMIIITFFIFLIKCLPHINVSPICFASFSVDTNLNINVSLIFASGFCIFLRRHKCQIYQVFGLVIENGDEADNLYVNYCLKPPPQLEHIRNACVFPFSLERDFLAFVSGRFAAEAQEKEVFLVKAN